ncbi:hypothetical protein ACFY2M_34595 [Streptomyces sp. NPDC001276]|uniref:hypothetical protein n=1 Tax=Streptomyces sp. NPDC001276 TaxID=3364555 RepID=UPI003677CA43
MDDIDADLVITRRPPSRVAWRNELTEVLGEGTGVARLVRAAKGCPSLVAELEAMLPTD